MDAVSLANMSHGLTKQEKGQLKDLEGPLRNFDHTFSHMEDIQSKKARTISPKNLELVNEDSTDSEFDLSTPDYVPMKKNQDNEETKRLMTDIELAYAKKKKSQQ